MLDPKLLNLLACPDCKLDLIYRRELKKEELVCGQCGRIFAVVDGIPVMTPKEK